MLGKLFGSNARVKILKLFLLHPGKKYYIRQLARELKLQINSVRRELENLESFGLLISSTGIDDGSAAEEFISAGSSLEKIIKEDSPNKQEKKYFQANTGFVLFEEIKALIVKSQILYKDDFIERIKKAGKVKLLILTGVFVNSNSPVDVLIVGRFSKKEKIYKTIKELEKELGREINFSIMDSREFKYRRDMTDVFLYNILEGKKLTAVDEVGI